MIAVYLRPKTEFDRHTEKAGLEVVLHFWCAHFNPQSLTAEMVSPSHFVGELFTCSFA